MVCSRDVEVFALLTPIGGMLLKTCSEGLHYLEQNKDISDKNFTPNKEQEVTLVGKPSKNDRVQTHTADCVSWLTEYFKNPGKDNIKFLPTFCNGIASENGSFQERVWTVLAKEVPFGKTVSYGELAKMANRPGASQAVGNAMAANPLQIVVPCHRVIRSDGSLGLYSSGKKNDVKLWLLEHEGLRIVNKRILLA